MSILQSEWTEKDGELLALSDPPVDQSAEFALQIADRPQMTRYRWPQDNTGLWCLTETSVRNMFDGHDGFVPEVGLQHSEIDFRWVSSNERTFLLENAIIAKTAPKEFRIYKAAEIHKLMETSYPQHHGRYQKYINDETAIPGEEGQQVDFEDAGTVSFEAGEVVKFDIGSLTAARQKAFAAVRQAARFNRILTYERQHERDEFYDANTQMQLIPTSKRLKLSAPASGGNRPVAVVAGQYQDGFKCYKSAKEAEAFFINSGHTSREGGRLGIATTSYRTMDGGISGGAGGGAAHQSGANMKSSTYGMKPVPTVAGGAVIDDGASQLERVRIKIARCSRSAAEGVVLCKRMHF
jgi:hypothetical protein